MLSSDNSIAVIPKLSCTGR